MENNKKTKRIYISGKITGLDIEVAKQYFETIENELLKIGHIPINPMKVIDFHESLTWHDYMAADIAALLRCDSIIMLENWTDSKGAKVEHAIAVQLGLEIYYCKNHNFF